MRLLRAVLDLLSAPSRDVAASLPPTTSVPTTSVLPPTGTTTSAANMETYFSSSSSHTVTGVADTPDLHLHGAEQPGARGWNPVESWNKELLYCHDPLYGFADFLGPDSNATRRILETGKKGVREKIPRRRTQPNPFLAQVERLSSMESGQLLELLFGFEKGAFIKDKERPRVRVVVDAATGKQDLVRTYDIPLNNDILDFYPHLGEPKKVDPWHEGGIEKARQKVQTDESFHHKRILNFFSYRLKRHLLGLTRGAQFAREDADAQEVGNVALTYAQDGPDEAVRLLPGTLYHNDEEQLNTRTNQEQDGTPVQVELYRAGEDVDAAGRGKKSSSKQRSSFPLADSFIPTWFGQHILLSGHSGEPPALLTAGKKGGRIGKEIEEKDKNSTSSTIFASSTTTRACSLGEGWRLGFDSLQGPETRAEKSHNSRKEYDLETAACRQGAKEAYSHEKGKRLRRAATSRYYEKRAKNLDGINRHGSVTDGRRWITAMTRLRGLNFKIQEGGKEQDVDQAEREEWEVCHEKQTHAFGGLPRELRDPHLSHQETSNGDDTIADERRSFPVFRPSGGPEIIGLQVPLYELLGRRSDLGDVGDLDQSEEALLRVIRETPWATRRILVRSSNDRKRDQVNLVLHEEDPVREPEDWERFHPPRESEQFVKVDVIYETDPGIFDDHGRDTTARRQTGRTIIAGHGGDPHGSPEFERKRLILGYKFQVLVAGPHHEHGNAGGASGSGAAPQEFTTQESPQKELPLSLRFAALDVKLAQGKRALVETKLKFRRLKTGLKEKGVDSATRADGNRCFFTTSGRQFERYLYP
ncbi:unnamed protein product [Amoebophrya sp. A25]|nr:unnamed protein product [Amoebophrya sp. A25]|eukprot:GSA25T00020771001.1